MEGCRCDHPVHLASGWVSGDGRALKRYLIHHGREGTWDLLDEDGNLSVERFQNHKRDRFTVDQFERSPEGKAFADRLKWALSRAKQQS